MNIPVNINHLSPEDRTEMQVRAMLHVVPEQIRKGSYQSVIGWKDTCRDALKALSMAGFKCRGCETIQGVHELIPDFQTPRICPECEERERHEQA